MRIQDIEIGYYYRFVDHPNYSWARAIEILKPKQGINTKNYSIIKCQHVIDFNDTMGFIRYFKASELEKDLNHDKYKDQWDEKCFDLLMFKLDL